MSSTPHANLTTITIERLLKRPIERLQVGELDHRHSRYEHINHSEHKEHKEHKEHRDRAPRDSDTRHERAPRAPRERPAEKPIAKAVHDGFDFSKPYEPGSIDSAAVKPAAPPRRGVVRPVAALLGGFSTRK